MHRTGIKIKIKIGVVNLTMFRPFPGELLGSLLKGRKGVAVLERVDQPLAEDLPLIREIRAALLRCVENGRQVIHEGYDSYKKPEDMPPLYSGSFGLGSRDLPAEFWPRLRPHLLTPLSALLRKKTRREPRPLVILGALYGDLPILLVHGRLSPNTLASPPTANANVTERLKTLVANNAVSIVVSSDLFGDPAPGILKRLVVDFSFGGEPGSRTVTEHDTLEIKDVGDLASPPIDATSVQAAFFTPPPQSVHELAERLTAGGLLVTDLTDQDHVGRLAQGVA